MLLAQWDTRPAWLAWGFAIAALSCGGGGGGGGGSPSADSFVGTYSAAYTGTYDVTSPAGVPNGTSTSTATITITKKSASEITALWQVPPNPPSGTIDFQLSGSVGNAVGKPTGGSCFTGKISNGNTQTNCCTQCSIVFTGDSFTQPNAGTFTGVTGAGVDYKGTYSGTWTGTKE